LGQGVGRLNFAAGVRVPASTDAVARQRCPALGKLRVQLHGPLQQLLGPAQVFQRESVREKLPCK